MNPIREFISKGGNNPEGKVAYNCFIISFFNPDGTIHEYTEKEEEVVASLFGENLMYADISDIHTICTWNESGMVFDSEEEATRISQDLTLEIQEFLNNGTKIMVEYLNQSEQ